MNKVLFFFTLVMLSSCETTSCSSFAGEYLFENNNKEIALLKLKNPSLGSIEDISSGVVYDIEWEYNKDNDQLFMYFDSKVADYFYTTLLSEAKEVDLENHQKVGIHRGFRQSCRSGNLERIYFDLDSNESYFERVK